MPAGVRVLEKSLLREYTPDEVVACFPDDLDKFIGPNTRVVAVSTHNPLGVTFAAGVYTSIYGSSKEPLNSIYSRVMFDKIKSSPYRKNFQVVVGGSGGWQITQTNAFEELGVDCVAEGRSESAGRSGAVPQGHCGETLPREIRSGSPHVARHDPVPRQADHVWRGRNDHRMRPPLPVLRARPESADRYAQGEDHGGGAGQRAAGQQARSRWRPRTCSSGARCTPTPRSSFPTAKRWWTSIAEIVNTPGWSSIC